MMNRRKNDVHEVDQRLMQFYFSNLLKQIIKISANIGKNWIVFVQPKILSKVKHQGFSGLWLIT